MQHSMFNKNSTNNTAWLGEGQCTTRVDRDWRNIYEIEVTALKQGHSKTTEETYRGNIHTEETYIQRKHT